MPVLTLHNHQYQHVIPKLTASDPNACPNAPQPPSEKTSGGGAVEGNKQQSPPPSEKTSGGGAVEGNKQQSPPPSEKTSGGGAVEGNKQQSPP